MSKVMCSINASSGTSFSAKPTCCCSPTPLLQEQCIIAQCATYGMFIRKYRQLSDEHAVCCTLGLKQSLVWHRLWSMTTACRCVCGLWFLPGIHSGGQPPRDGCQQPRPAEISVWRCWTSCWTCHGQSRAPLLFAPCSSNSQNCTN